MSDEVLNNGGQVGQPESATPETTPQNGAMVQGEQSATQNEQPLSLTQSQLEEFVNERLNAAKKDWLSEAYRNTQSINDKFEKRVNDTISAFEKAGIKADKVSVTNYLKSEDKRASDAAAIAQQQKAQQANVDPNYQAFLDRFGVKNGNDARLSGAYSLEQEYGVQLEKGDPEYKKYFGDPTKRFSSYQFQRDYERALTEKKERTATEQTSVAGVPSMSGNGRHAERIQNNTSSADIFAMAMEEMRNKGR